jgi:hypothetical protein
VGAGQSKSAVTSPHLYEPDLNPTYAEPARHYGGGDSSSRPVGYFARRAGVLPLHAHRVLALLEEADVVHNPHFHRLASSHLLQRVLRRHPTHLLAVVWATEFRVKLGLAPILIKQQPETCVAEERA